MYLQPSVTATCHVYELPHILFITARWREIRQQKSAYQKPTIIIPFKLKNIRNRILKKHKSKKI